MPTSLDLPQPCGELNERVALITGGSSGIGLETARNLVSRGCNVIITSQTQESGDAAIEKIRKLITLTSNGATSPKVEWMPLHIEGPLKDLDTFAQEFRSRWSRLDFLVFNAGHGQFQWDAQYDGLSQCYVERLAYQHVLTSRFWDLLVSSGTQDKPSCVITTAGFAIKWSKCAAQEWLELVKNKGVEGQKLDLPALYVAQAGWTKCLGSVCKDTQKPVRFLLTHPGFALGTGIAKGCKKGCMLPVISCFIGSHSAKEACLSNVAGIVLAADLPQGSFLGPLHTFHGPPANINLEQEKDAHEWKAFADEEAIFEIGKTTLYELAVKTNSPELEDICADAKLIEKRYDGYDSKQQQQQSESTCTLQ